MDALSAIPYEVGRMGTLDGDRYEVPYHILGYSWSGEHPVWTMLPMKRKDDELFPSGGPFDIDPVKMKRVEFRSSNDHHCVGRFSDGVHIPCPYSAEVEQFSQCPSCMKYDIPDPVCVFEPHCNKGTCGAPFCQIEHVVYLTSFRGRHKVGMTQLRRYEKRGREQGADLIFPLLVLADRYSARAVEGGISRYLKLPQAVRSPVKLKGWGAPLRKGIQTDALLRVKRSLVENWDDVLSGLPDDVRIERGPEETDLAPAALTYPLKEPLDSSPRAYKGSIVRGDVVGYKGNYLVFRSSGLYAYRIGETPGKILYFRDELHH
ncbi:MAG: DUF2797 domain-containing protein [Candidatus Thermoplasmatota archaeon]|nr:DUF2797 domain-containing protein [Candidatus Thermoplasmatota archaeon]